MQTTIEITESQWQIAHTIAIELVKAETDRNEFSKTISYLRAYADRENAGENFLNYLATLARNGNKIGHSKKTVEYYKDLDRVCQKYLKTHQKNVPKMLQILGWTSRLMYYYKKAVPTGELNNIEYELEVVEVQPNRQVEIQRALASQHFAQGQKIEAKITAIQGNKLTYEILETIKLSQKEPKHYQLLKEGQIVTKMLQNLLPSGK
jgi:hypothetical protein